MESSYEPIIIGFLCNWCSYRAADLAGMARLHYAHNLRSVRLMCTGRVEAEFILHAFEKGADGVLIAGCHPGECHYADGNLKALRRYALIKRLLKQLGIEEERLKIVWASASEGAQLADTVNMMVSKLKLLGPLYFNSKTVPASAGDKRAARQADYHP